MLTLASILVWPLVACVSMGLIHGYTGLHILRRGVIFVDLALAQMAALGAVVGLVIAPHHSDHHHPPPAAIVATAPGDELDQAVQQTGQVAAAPAGDEDDEAASRGLLEFWPTVFALLGAVLLAFGRVPGDRVPHEAIIGIVYVVSAAATVLILSKSPHGHEQMEQMLTGKLLFVDRQEVLTTGGIYAVLGLMHWIFRRPFLAISASPEAAQASGMYVRLWDCLFYAMFAIMVTRSVAIGGVLIVFSFLIIPGACAALLADGFRNRIIIAWTTAMIVSVVGVGVSAQADLPTGSTLVATFGVALLLCLMLAPLFRVHPKTEPEAPARERTSRDGNGAKNRARSASEGKNY